VSLHLVAQSFQLVLANLIILKNHLIKTFEIERSNIIEIASSQRFLMERVTNKELPDAYRCSEML